MDQLAGIPNKVAIYVQQAMQTYLSDLDMDSQIAQSILTYFETHDMSEIIGTAVTDAISNLGLHYDSTKEITTYKSSEIANEEDTSVLNTRITAVETKTQQFAYDSSNTVTTYKGNELATIDQLNPDD
jgi:hypothetical protein